MSTAPQSRQVLPPKRKYEREFLLGLQFVSASLQKPEGLPHISEVVLDKPNTVPLTPLDGSHPRGTNCGSEFTSPFISRGRPSIGGRGPPQMDSPRGYQQVPCEEPRRILPSMPLGGEVQLNRAANAWRPAVRTPAAGDRGGEDPEAAGTQELLCRVRSVLNKLTPERFQPLTRQLAALAIHTERRLRGVVRLVFDKAVSEPKFSVTYANMCRCLRELSVPAMDNPGDTLTFCSLLLDLCWKEFKKIRDDDKIYEQRKKEPNAVTTEEERQRLKEELEAEEEAHRRRLLGNVRFIGELFKLELVRESAVRDCVTRLLGKRSEEALECLCCLLSTGGKSLDCHRAKPHMDQYFTQMEKIVQEKKTSSRIRFMLQDVLDLRQNNWVPRRADQGPKTIDQVHKEAELEKQQEQMKVQLLPKRDRHPLWGCGGQSQEEGWSSSPIAARNHTIDGSQLSRISKLGSLDINSLLFTPGGEGSWRSWSRGSNGGSCSKRSGEPEWCCPSSPQHCYSPLQKSFTPPAHLADCYSRVSQRSNWSQDCGEHTDRYSWHERSGHHGDHPDQRDEWHRQTPTSRRSCSRGAEESEWDHRGPAGAAHSWTRARWDRGRGGSDRGQGNCATPARLAVAQPSLAKTDPDQPNPVQPSLAKNNSDQPSPDNTDPDQPGPVQPSSAEIDPTKPTPAKTDPAKTDPAKPNPAEPSPVQPIMPEDKLEKKSKAIIEEYLHINDLKEALLCVRELTCVPLLSVFVRSGVETALERDAVARERTGRLLQQLVQAGTLPAQQYYRGMQEILEVAEDMAIDIPHIWLYLAEIIVPMLGEGGLPMGQLLREVSKPLVPLGKAGELLVEILLLLCKATSHAEAAALWREAGLSWTDFLLEDEDISESVTERICSGCALEHCPMRT
ncbi:eukaryotic translation initiation factor 4 gamma 1-like [Megalops cyprinoides]|uniref:eukaryotic translation initiation factor 4 gamma 1-like n=1 Tax=Megalops cyprinoides TaxID=118141 RepID=UPI001863C7B4|nr:eukaryotic translation initiation factor 4 gamma 1-like [Megalops cyprinoides]